MAARPAASDAGGDVARYAKEGRDRIDATVERWKERCLLADRSLVFDHRDGVWTLAAAEEMYRRFNQTPLEGAEGGGKFLSKWELQLQDASEEVRLFAAELILVHFLFASSVTKDGKLRVIKHTLGDSGTTLPEDALAVQALSQSIGHPGIGFNTRRDVQVAYLIDFVRRFKALDRSEAERLLGDPWALRTFADDTDEPKREMRHIVLHLLAPESFERISSGTHKREIADAFEGLIEGDPAADVDERLLAIRERLAELLPVGNTPSKQVDFYHQPLHGVWESAAGGEGEGVGDLEALEWKRQLVLYGPPGTSKTFLAERIAETLIRRAALKRWGAEAFFENQDAADRLASARPKRADDQRGSNIEWLQLHPGYGYEQFIRGMRLEGEKTVYRRGLLPDIVERRMQDQELPEGFDPLPFVLVLDEINRTDLSAMFGEAFSLLERDKRGKPVELPGINAEDDPDTLVIPEDLYVLGTMNEIDQSVETLDFALRRRFLWRECPFDRDTLLVIVRERWEEDIPRPHRFTYEDASEQLERFADRAVALNEAVAESAELGRQFQIGHTYFADVTFFLGTWLHSRRHRPSNGRYLWDGHGKPQPALPDLWSRSLKPLMEQYLAGSDVRDEEIARFEAILLDRS